MEVMSESIRDEIGDLKDIFLPLTTPLLEIKEAFLQY